MLPSVVWPCFFELLQRGEVGLDVRGGGLKGKDTHADDASLQEAFRACYSPLICGWFGYLGHCPRLLPVSLNFALKDGPSRVLCLKSPDDVSKQEVTGVPSLCSG